MAFAAAAALFAPAERSPRARLAGSATISSRFARPPDASVAPSGSAVPDDPWWPAEWGLDSIGMTRLWRLTEGAPSTVIAVIDSGVDPTNPDLAGALLPGWNAIDGSSDTRDEIGHGTEVAEIAAGRGNNGVQGAGLCWRCTILPIKVVGEDGAGTPHDLAAGIDWAAQHGADIINVSLVLASPDPEVQAAVDDARRAGALVVAAAGNAGTSSPAYPAALPGVLGVVALDPVGRPYSWSSRGEWAQYGAPGCSVVASTAGRRTSFCGSSAAAPVVAGLAGLLWSAGVDSSDGIERVLGKTDAVLPGGTVAQGEVDARNLADSLLEESAPSGTDPPRKR